MSVEVSVVIPTFRRLDVLPEVLDALERQVDAPSFEIVVVDDGSADGTAAYLNRRRFRVPVRILQQSNQGPAAARNHGVEVAEGTWVAFLGDDTVPSPGWLAAHRRAHRERGDGEELAVIGYTGWHRRVPLTPFLKYINEYGLQFGYALIEDSDSVPFNFFYTSNLSLHRSRLLAEPFDTRFPYPAYEDIECGYRLMEKRGGRLLYRADAITAHDHPTTIDRFMKRQEKAGYCGVVFALLHPELSGWVGVGSDGPPPIPEAPRQRRLETLARVLQNLPVPAPRLWETVLRYHYIRGLHRGWHERARRQPKGDSP
ncbi:MAG: glycosyltransferase [Acidobacteriota bacterium]